MPVLTHCNPVAHNQSSAGSVQELEQRSAVNDLITFPHLSQ